VDTDVLFCSLDTGSLIFTYSLTEGKGEDGSLQGKVSQLLEQYSSTQALERRNGYLPLPIGALKKADFSQFSVSKFPSCEENMR
jgi:hypothetical protein